MLIDLFHDHTEGAGQHKGGRHGEQPPAHLCMDIDRVCSEQEVEGAADRGDSAHYEPEAQPAVGLLVADASHGLLEA